MHEVSLNRLITDYLSGREIMDTTYEDLRQSLARMLVEERKYPRQHIQAKHAIRYRMDGAEQESIIDLAVFSPTGEPLLALFFCPGEVGTFVREAVAAARVHEPLPFPLVVVTDSMNLSLVATQSAEVIAEGFLALPLWQALPEMAATYACPALTADRLEKERRILLAYNGLGGPCCGGECSL